MEVKSDIDPIEMEEKDMTIQLANKEIICPVRIVRDVEVLLEKSNILLISLLLLFLKIASILSYLGHQSCIL
jgi:hypothetical protein